MRRVYRPVSDRTAFRVGLVAIIIAIVSGLFATPAQATRIKEVAAVQGVRSNQLVGYGLVIGLDGTGDQTTQAPFTTQGLQSMLQQLGVTLPAGTTMQLKNVAAVIVTASLPTFAQTGQAIDIDVSSVANAKSLRGGTLVARRSRAPMARSTRSRRAT